MKTEDKPKTYTKEDVLKMLDDIETIVVGYIGDKDERICARSRLADFKEELK